MSLAPRVRSPYSEGSMSAPRNLHLGAARLRIVASLAVVGILVAASVLALLRFGFFGSAPERVEGAVAGALLFRDADDRIVALNEPGRLYLIDFMAVGCKPCMKELPQLVRLSREFAGSNRFQVVLIVYAQRGEVLRKLADELAIGSLPLYADAEHIGETLRVTGWPTKFLVRDGRLLYRKFGSGWGDHARWRRIVLAELQSQS